jgi:AhpD family alkylhydroperoxidase
MKMFDEKIKELIAIGASISANCHPCIKFHTKKARELKIDEAEIQQAIEVGKMVRKGAASQMDKLVEEIL